MTLQDTGSKPAFLKGMNNTGYPFDELMTIIS